MPGAARVGLDSATSTITGNLAPTVMVNGVPIAVVGAQDGPAVMVEGSATVLANGIPVCRVGDLDSFDVPASPGSTNVIVGG